MPTPVACLLNNPDTTFKRDRNGVIGSRLLLNSMLVPAPFAHQCLGLMPLPMNRAANRRGAAAAGSAPQTGSDSSHGSAIVTPTPLSNVRRLIRESTGLIIRPPNMSLSLRQVARQFSWHLNHRAATRMSIRVVLSLTTAGPSPSCSGIEDSRRSFPRRQQTETRLPSI